MTVDCMYRTSGAKGLLVLVVMSITFAFGALAGGDVARLDVVSEVVTSTLLVERPDTRPRRVVILGVVTASSECPPSSVRRRRERTTK